ncbi:hypothetical protein ABT330_33385 [Streptomyces sp. NPDC000658]
MTVRVRAGERPAALRPGARRRRAALSAATDASRGGARRLPAVVTS